MNIKPVILAKNVNWRQQLSDRGLSSVSVHCAALTCCPGTTSGVPHDGLSITSDRYLSVNRSQCIVVYRWGFTHPCAHSFDLCVLVGFLHFLSKTESECEEVTLGTATSGAPRRAKTRRCGPTWRYQMCSKLLQRALISTTRRGMDFFLTSEQQSVTIMTGKRVTRG